MPGKSVFAESVFKEGEKDDCFEREQNNRPFCDIRQKKYGKS